MNKQELEVIALALDRAGLIQRDRDPVLDGALAQLVVMTLSQLGYIIVREGSKVSQSDGVAIIGGSIGNMKASPFHADNGFGKCMKCGASSYHSPIPCPGDTKKAKGDDFTEWGSSGETKRYTAHAFNMRTGKCERCGCHTDKFLADCIDVNAKEQQTEEKQDDAFLPISDILKGRTSEPFKLHLYNAFTGVCCDCHENVFDVGVSDRCAGKVTSKGEDTPQNVHGVRTNSLIYRESDPPKTLRDKL